MDRKKILFLEQYSKISGGQKVLLSLLNGLKDYYDFHVVVPEKGDITKKFEDLKIEYITFPIGYYSIGKKTLFDIANYLVRLPYLIYRLIMLIKDKNIDLVYANGARTFVWGTIACTLTNTPMLWHLHSIFEKLLVRNICFFFGRFKIVKKIIAVSDCTRKPLSVLGDKIQTIYNGIDTEIFYPGKKDNGLRNKFGGDDEFLVAVVGLVIEWKNQEDLIRAAEIITNKNNKKVKFLIVGDPLYQDDKGQTYKKKLQTLVNRLQLGDKFIFTGFRDNIAAIMRSLDVLVITSKDPDPCPLTLLEAMGTGLAVIATNFGGPAEIINDGRDGLLYTARDYKGLADKILYLLENDEVRAKISQRAYSKIKKDFAQTDYIKKIKTIVDTYA